MSEKQDDQKAAAQKAWDDWHDCIGAVTDEDDDHVPTMSIQWETAFRAGARWALEQAGAE